MSNKLFHPTTLAVVCSSVLSTVAMAAPQANLAANDYINEGVTNGSYNISAIENGTFNNSGTVNATGANDVHGIKISQSQFDSIVNSGTMTGKWNAISVEYGSTVGKIENSGDLVSQKQYGIYVAGNGTTVDSIDNTGSITGPNGIYVENGAKVNTIHTGGDITTTGTGVRVIKSTVDTIHHTGAITSNQWGVSFDDSNIGSFTIDEGASIKTTGNAVGSYASDAIRIAGSHVTNFVNKGTVEGSYGMHFLNGKVDNFTNSGTITGRAEGIKLSQWYGNSVIKNLTNTGVIEAKNGYGIYMESNSTIENLVNSGKIIGTTAGISNIASWKEVPAHIGTITVKKDGVIQATNGNGIQLVKQGPNFVSIDSITLEEGGSIVGSKSGIWFAGNTGTNKITNNGLIKGSSGLWNDGRIGTESGGFGVVVGATGAIEGTGNVGIGNTGSILGGLNIAGQVTGKTDGIRNTGSITSSAGNNAVHISGQVSSLVNSGSIDATDGGVHGVKVVGSTATLGALTNQKNGTIAGTWSGVSIEGGATVDSITNAGSITGEKNSGIYVSGSTVQNIVNSGTVSGSSAGIGLYGATIGTIETNGAVSASHQGMTVNTSTIDTLKIGSSGSITSSGSKTGSYGDYGILFIGSTVKNVENAGNIEGSFGIVFQNGHITNFTNSGKILGRNQAGIYFSPWYNNSSVGTLNNSGTIESRAGAGIYLEAASSINELITSGSIIGTDAGISNLSWKTTIAPSKIGKIVVAKGGVIQSKNGNGIRWYNQGVKDVTLGGLEIQDGGEVKAAGSGVWFQAGANVGSIVVDGSLTGTGNALYNDATITSQGAGYAVSVGATGRIDSTKGVGITNTGKIDGGVAIAGFVKNIKNTGTIDSTAIEGNSGLVVTGSSANVGAINNTGKIIGAVDGIQIGEGATVESVTSTGTLTGTSGYAFNNAGHVTGAVTLQGTYSGGLDTVNNSGDIDGGLNLLSTNTSANYTIQNDGRIDGAVTLNTSGDVTVKNWTVHDGNTNVEFKNAGSGDVIVQKVTVADAGTLAKATRGGVNTMSLFSLNGQDLAVEDVAIDSELTQLGFTSTFDAGSQSLLAEVNGADTTGGILGQSVATQTMRRDFFVNTMVDEAVQSAQVNATGQEGYTSVFAKPYGSHDSYKAGGAKLSGETYGLLLGANYIQGNVGLTAYAGYEHGDHDGGFAGSDLGIKNDTFYLGATGFGTVASTANMDVFVKTGVKAAFTRNSLDRTLTNTYSEASTNATSWGANAQLGVNYKMAQNSIITPVVGLGFSNAKVNDFSMLHDSTSVDSYELNNINLPYGEVAVTWQQGWTDSIRTNVGGGVRVLFDKSQTMSSTYNTTKLDNNYDLSGSYEYVTANMAWKVNKNNEISVGYTGVFEDHGQSHNMTAKYEYMF